MIESLKEAERIADKLLKAVEEAKPLLQDLRSSMEAYRILHQRVRSLVDDLATRQELVKERYELIEKLGKKSDHNLDQLAEKAAIVSEELAEMNARRQELAQWAIMQGLKEHRG